MEGPDQALTQVRWVQAALAGRHHRAPVPSSKASNALQQQPSTASDDWTPVVHKETGLTYFWNTKTNQTTALGAPQPGSPADRALAQRSRPAGVVQSVAGLVAAGAGIGLIFSLFGRMF